MAAKEQQLLELRDEFGKLKQDNERAKERLQEEIAAVKQLEAQLAALSECLVCDCTHLICTYPRSLSLIVNCCIDYF